MYVNVPRLLRIAASERMSKLRLSSIFFEKIFESNRANFY